MLEKPILKENLQSPKQKSDWNKWADYIELLCWISPDGHVSVDFVLDKCLDELGLKSSGNTTEYQELEDDIYKGGSLKPKDDDEKQQHIERLFLFLSCRQQLYAASYPFSIDEDIISIDKEHSLSQKLYLCLLISSNLGSVDNYKNLLTNKFEELGVYFLREILSDKFNVHYFGKGADIPSPFPAKLFEKYQALSSLLNLHLSPEITEEYVGKYNTGDNGLDIVAWYPFKDSGPGTMMFFVQSACGKQWFEKQWESHAFRWKGIFWFKNDPTNLVLIPRSYRDEEGQWKNPTKIEGSVIIDRLRFLRSFSMGLAHCIDLYEPILNSIATNKHNYFD